MNEGMTMKTFFKTMEWVLLTTYNSIKMIVNVFRKAIEIIKPKNWVEWIILIIAIPVPFGVTAMFIYKYMKYDK